MIQQDQKEKILSLLGVRYSRRVSEYLSEKGITTKSGSDYGLGFIRQVMNGDVSHEEIEAAIFELVEIKQAEQSKREKLLENI